MLDALKQAHAFPYIIGTKRSPITPDNSKGTEQESMKPDHHLEGFRSTMVDALFVPGDSHVSQLSGNGRTLHWIAESFGHCKVIAATGAAVPLVQKAISAVGSAVETSDSGVINSYGLITAESFDAPTGPIRFTQDSTDFLGQFFYSISLHRMYQREVDGLTKRLAF